MEKPQGNPEAIAYPGTRSSTAHARAPGLFRPFTIQLTRGAIVSWKQHGVRDSSAVCAVRLRHSTLVVRCVHRAIEGGGQQLQGSL